MLKIISLFLISLFFPFTSFAAEESLDPCAADSTLTTCKAAHLQVGGALGTVIQFLFVIAVILALGFLIFGGVKWITSGGDKGGVEAARNMIVASIIGLILVFVAYVVLNLVLIFLTGSGIGGIKIPTLGGSTAADKDVSCGGVGQGLCTGINPFCDSGLHPDDPINPTTCIAN